MRNALTEDIEKSGPYIGHQKHTGNIAWGPAWSSIRRSTHIFHVATIRDTVRDVANESEELVR